MRRKPGAERPLLNGEYWATSKVETLDILLRSARVGSPELLCLGELKGREAWDLVLAGNLGTGLLAAVHADSVPLGFESLATAAAPAVPAMSPDNIRDKFARTFEVAVFVDMATVAGRAVRKVTEISVVPPAVGGGGGGHPDLFADDLDGELELRTTSLTPQLARRCDRAWPVGASPSLTCSKARLDCDRARRAVRRPGRLEHR